MNSSINFTSEDLIIREINQNEWMEALQRVDFSNYLQSIEYGNAKKCTRMDSNKIYN